MQWNFPHQHGKYFIGDLVHLLLELLIIFTHAVLRKAEEVRIGGLSLCYGGYWSGRICNSLIRLLLLLLAAKHRKNGWTDGGGDGHLLSKLESGDFLSFVNERAFVGDCQLLSYVGFVDHVWYVWVEQAWTKLTFVLNLFDYIPGVKCDLVP